MFSQNAWPTELPPGQVIMPQWKSERRACKSVMAGEVGGAGRASVGAELVERMRRMVA